MKKKYITAAEFDKRFDAAEDLSEHYDLDQATRPALEQGRRMWPFRSGWFIK